MEKIISINFQGRVIPIEETAYNQLKKYIDSLRAHFANEESSDEIINDIENRIAELLSDRLKRGPGCVGSADVQAVINSIGRLEDIEAAEGEEQSEPVNNARQQRTVPPVQGRFYRNTDDKVIAGVCSGIAIRTGIDPVIVRILFVLLIGAFFWLYLLLWIIVPAQSVQSDITRRLYRNPDDKMIAGVCGGLAAYLRVDSKVTRFVFFAPLVFSIISGGIHRFWWDWGWGFGPRIFLGSFTGTFVIGYIILWIALPYASTSADKLEMRGEKVDLNSIKEATKSRTAVNQPPVRHRSGLGHVIGILFKAFFLFIAGSVAIGLFGALIALVFGGVFIIPFTHFLFHEPIEYVLAWTGIILTLGVPMLALVTWLIRRLMGVQSRRHYLGYVFSGLWVIGFACAMTLVGIVSHNFRHKYVQEETVALVRPAASKLIINVGSEGGWDTERRHSRWLSDWKEKGSGIHLINNDSLWLNTVKVKVAQSNDSMFHMYKLNIARSSNEEEAMKLAKNITFSVAQFDSVVVLPRGFAVSSKDQFRNQQVMIVVEVPIGKTIVLDKGIRLYDWFSININGGSEFNVERDWRESYYYRSNREYLMMPKGLRNVKDSTDRAEEQDNSDDEE